MNYKLWLPIVLALGAFACAAPAPTKDVQPASDTPKRGGTLNARAFTDFFDFDPSYAGKSQPNPEAHTLVYERLVGFKSGEGIKYDDLIITPELAERWEASPDATRFTLHLRPGVKFGPSTGSGNEVKGLNGRELTSADVKWSYEYFSRTGQFKDAQFGGKKLPQAQFAWFFEGMTRIETPDPQTAIIYFETPFAPFVNYMASDAAPIVPKEIYEQDGHLKDRMVGTGPFTLDTAASQKGSRWVFKRNPTAREAPNLDEIRFLVLSDESTSYAAFQTKQIDLLGVAGGVGAITFEDAAQIKKNNPDATVSESLNPVPWNLYIQNDKPPFNDPRVRKALSLAVDRDEYLRAFSGGKGGWAMAGAMPDTWSQEEIRQMVKYDPEQAKKLLAEAGLPNGLNTKFMIRGDDGGDRLKREAQLLQAQLKKANINMELEITADKTVGAQRMYAGQYELIALNKAMYGDVDSYLYAPYHSKSSANWTLKGDLKLDSLIERQRAEADPAKRRDIIRETSKYLFEQTIGLAIYRGVVYQAWQPYVKNYYPSWQGNPVSDAWIDR